MTIEAGPSRPSERTYTVTDGANSTVYRGFSALTQHDNKGTLCAIIWFEGSPEIWALDTTEALHELHRFYRAHWPGHDLRVQTFVLDINLPWLGARI